MTRAGTCSASTSAVPPVVPDVQVGSGTTEAWWGVDPVPFQIGQRAYISDPSTYTQQSNIAVVAIDGRVVVG